MPEEIRVILGREHADDQHQRTRHPLLKIGRAPPRSRGRHRDCVRHRARVRCRRASVRQPACRRRCMRAGHSALINRLRKPAAAICKPAARKAAIAIPALIELMAAVKPRRRQIEQAVVVLIDEAAVFLARIPVLPRQFQRRAHALGALLDHRQRLIRLRRDDHRHATLDDAGFLRRDPAQACRRDIRHDRARPA